MAGRSLLGGVNVMWAMRGIAAAGVLVATISLLHSDSAGHGLTLDGLGYGPLSLVVCDRK